jgi:hypothetical protein
MAAHEQSLVELRNRLEVVLGATEAATLMEHLPSGRPATETGLDEVKTDLAELKSDVDRASTPSTIASKWSASS